MAAMAAAGVVGSTPVFMQTSISSSASLSSHSLPPSSSLPCFASLSLPSGPVSVSSRSASR
eukprot:26847-Hanusia_phi.AAC.1